MKKSRPAYWKARVNYLKKLKPNLYRYRKPAKTNSHRFKEASRQYRFGRRFFGSKGLYLICHPNQHEIPF